MAACINETIRSKKDQLVLLPSDRSPSELEYMRHQMEVTLVNQLGNGGINMATGMYEILSEAQKCVLY